MSGEVLLELMSAVQITRYNHESNQRLLKRIILGINRLPDDQWYKLSRDAQVWARTAIEAFQAQKVIPLLPGMEKAPKNKKELRISQGAGVLLRDEIIKQILSDPNQTAKEVLEVLTKRGIFTTFNTVSVGISNFRNVVSVLDAHGFLRAGTILNGPQSKKSGRSLE